MGGARTSFEGGRVMRIPRKWELIAEWLEAHNYDEAAKVARFIDSAMKTWFGDRHTVEWEETYKFIQHSGVILDVWDISQLAEDPCLCTACEVAGDLWQERFDDHEGSVPRCDFCILAKLGVCALGENDAFHHFVDLLEKLK